MKKAYVVLALIVFCSFLAFGVITDGLSGIPESQRATLTERLSQYVSSYKARDWGKLYEYVSSRGKNGLTKEQFIAAMNAEHGTDFGQMPDLLSFIPAKTSKVSDGYNVYGCGKAQREGMAFNGVAVVHTVFEGSTWNFSGWSFTEFPNEPCKELKAHDWSPDTELEFTSPMDEVQHFKSSGVPFHVD